jgi:hypothetical protein
MARTENLLAATALAVAVVIGGVAASGCGGKDKPPEAPSDVAASEGDGDEVVPGDQDMVAPERMDEIKALLDRKRTIVARCLPEAIGAGKAEKNARGRVTFEFVISRQGKARDIKVAEATLDSDMVQECTMNHIANIDFGALPRDLEWSYTYSFEAY